MDIALHFVTRDSRIHRPNDSSFDEYVQPEGVSTNTTIEFQIALQENQEDSQYFDHATPGQSRNQRFAISNLVASTLRHGKPSVEFRLCPQQGIEFALAPVLVTELKANPLLPTTGVCMAFPCR